MFKEKRNTAKSIKILLAVILFFVGIYMLSLIIDAINKWTKEIHNQEIIYNTVQQKESSIPPRDSTQLIGNIIVVEIAQYHENLKNKKELRSFLIDNVTEYLNSEKRILKIYAKLGNFKNDNVQIEYSRSKETKQASWEIRVGSQPTKKPVKVLLFDKDFNQLYR